MRTDFDVQQWTRQNARALADEMFELAASAAKFAEFGMDSRTRLCARQLDAADGDPWHAVSRLALGLVAGLVSRDLGREVRPRHLKRMLEHFAVLVCFASDAEIMNFLAEGITLDE